jgi:DNA-binding MarR family transcriptional regulator
LSRFLSHRKVTHSIIHRRRGPRSSVPREIIARYPRFLIPSRAMQDKPKDSDGVQLLQRTIQLHGEFRRSLEPTGVTPLQASILTYLHDHSEVPPRTSWLAVHLRLSIPTLSEAVLNMIQKKWMTRERAFDDRRASELRLTKQGRLVAQKILSALNGHGSRLLK